ncbi:type IV toxin-antitoxin system AbiEi family antitoxin domain-containing protein [Thermoleophilia bacterium SCSIO 60948]|nr:type IV toxin-antitoxin system AbiEi family antitoxin domain-containing protein [Thermoleophilia bacterium SCSIO 60948]
MKGQARSRLSPSALDARIESAARPQRGAVRRSQLLAAEVLPQSIDTRVRAGRLIVFARGIYVLASAPDREEAEAMAALLWAGDRSALSHLAAARLDALPIPDRLFAEPRFPIDVTAQGLRRARRRRVRVHSTKLASDETKGKGPLRLTRALRTIADLSPLMGAREVEQTVATCLRRGMFDREAISLHVERHPRTAGTAAMRPFPSSVPAMTRSEAEELLRALLSAAGEPPPRMNHRVEGREVDAFWPRERLVIEVQSRQWHGGEHALEADAEKAALLAALGYVVLPVTATQLIKSPASVTSCVIHALTRLRQGPAARGSDRG